MAASRAWRKSRALVQGVLLNDCFDLVQTGRALRSSAAHLRSLQIAVAVHCSADELIFSCLRRLPLIAPEYPGQSRAWVIDLGLGPGLAVVEADLDLRNAAIAAERASFDRRRFVDGDRLVERVLAAVPGPLGGEDIGAGRDHEVRSPTLRFIKAFAITIEHFDA